MARNNYKLYKKEKLLTEYLRGRIKRLQNSLNRAYLVMALSAVINFLLLFKLLIH